MQKQETLDTGFYAPQIAVNARLAGQASHVLLIRAGENNSRIHSFFENKELPSDTVAVLSSLYSGVDTKSNTIYYYSFDISSVLTSVLHSDPTQFVLGQHTLRMAIVPVSVVTSTDGGVVSIKEAQEVSATRLYSEKNPAAHMTLQVVSSLFSNVYR